MSNNGSGYYYYNGTTGVWKVADGPLDASSIYIGFNAGKINQGDSAIAIGANAGYKDQSSNAIAIGAYAGSTNQHANSIIINATGNDLSSNSSSSLYIAPIRNSVNNNILFYNSTTKEITYDISNSIISGASQWTTSGSNIYNNNSGNVGIGTYSPSSKLDVSGTVTIRNTLDLCNNNINDISSVRFHDGYSITSNYFSGNSQPTLRLPLYSDTFVHPISVMRMSYFSNDVSFSVPANGGGVETLTPISLGSSLVNQVGLTFDASNIKFTIPNDISGQFIELYINIKDSFPNNGDYRVDISGTNNSLKETVGYVSTGSLTASALTFGPHSINRTEFYPGYIFMLVITSSKAITIQKTETIFKSHFI